MIYIILQNLENIEWGTDCWTSLQSNNNYWVLGVYKPRDSNSDIKAWTR